MGERESRSGFFGLLAVGMGVCCGLPLLFSVGVLGAAGGLGFGSGLAILIGVAVAVLGLWRWRRNAASCRVPASDEVSNYEAGIDDRAL
jgi:hypothetical protein